MKTKSLLNRKVQLAFGAAILALLAAGVISYRGLIQSTESDRWVRHTHQVVEELQDVLSAMQSAESSYRGFALTGDESYLQSYRTGIVSADGLRPWCSLSPIETPEGLLISSAIRDVTASKKAAQALRISEQKFRGILDSAPDAMVIADSQGLIVLLNAETERLFGYRRDELIGHPVEILVPKRFAANHPKHRQEYLEPPLTRTMGAGLNLWALRKDHTEFPVEISLSSLETPEGMLVTTAIRDITDRKKSEVQLTKAMSELKRSNGELQQFAYVASHDLQEPLRMVASYTQLLAKRYKGSLDSDADEFIGYAVDGCNRMQGLILDLLAYSRAGAELKELREISSESALQHALNSLHVSIRKCAALITHDPLPTLISDDAQLALVFQHLVANAIKYHGSEAPRVHVSVSKNGALDLFRPRQRHRHRSPIF
jgi:PAS domain S-box-containing protein